MRAFLPGLLTGLSLIIAIGAQNAFVIRQGLTKKHVFLVVAICALSDVILIFLGVAGLGALIQGLPGLIEIIRWFGAIYLIWFGIKSLISAVEVQSLEHIEVEGMSTGMAVAASLGFTFLNPHVYLDTVIFIGSLAAQFNENRWWFASGASMASILWFSTIGFGAKLAAHLLNSPVFWRVTNLLIGLTMMGLAIGLLKSELFLNQG